MLNELTIKQAAEGLRAKKFSSVELTEACLARVKERNKEINAFITVRAEEALAEAAAADKLLKTKKAGPLTGIPFCVKDSIATKGVRSTAAAKILDNYIPPFDAAVIAKIRGQGGVLIGKNNCDAFGHGASNENSMYGPVRNPRDLTKVSGGSSGGTAAAVADSMCIYGIGEDTGGSIRQPASFCGIVGLRPSYGRNSRYGVMPMASSLDVVGPLTKTVEDTAIVLEVIAGRDPLDATTVGDEVPKYTAGLGQSVKGLKIGVPKEYFEVAGMDAEVEKIVKAQIDQLVKAGARVKEVSLPHTKYAIAVYYIVVPSEDSSNLGRLEGVRYGARVDLSPPVSLREIPRRGTRGVPPPARGGVRGGGREGEGASSLFNLYAASRAAGFPEEVKRRILIGAYALSAGYYDAYYKKAQQVRTLIRRDFDLAFQEVDALITPTSPFPAFGIGEKADDPLSLYLADVLAAPAGVAGVPALSVPAGVTKAGLPVGAQIMGARMAEETVLRVGYFLTN